MSARLANYEKKAETLKILGHPVRLCIVNGLIAGECNVTTIKDCLNLPQSTISQHLGILKAYGIIKGKRDGLKMVYSVVDEEVIDLMKTFMREAEPFQEGKKN
ncbi:MAG: winged helix-turn-helix transcriptional regulator [Clostridiales bacterium]|nr:winged helix-turn-helix transcriptional regulator [Clostridiales bacterium]